MRRSRTANLRFGKDDSEMSIKSGRTVLLMAAGSLVLSSGLAFAQSVITRGVDDENMPDLPAPGFVVDSNVQLSTPSAPTAPGVETQTATRITGPSDLVGPTPALDNEAVPDVDPGAVTQRQVGAGAVLAKPPSSWDLSGYRGATIRSETGEVVGTVDTLAYNFINRLYLVVTLPDAGRKTVPLGSVGYDPTTGDLLVDAATARSIRQSIDYDEVANAYTEISSDQEYMDLIAMYGDPF
jgi:hypothetical protein